MDTPLTQMPDPKAISAWLIEGHGLPAKIGIGAPHCPGQVFLEILKRDPATRDYATAKQITCGGVAIDPLRGAGDFCRTSAGGSFAFEGKRLTGPRPHSIRTAVGFLMPNSAWRVTTLRGCFLFVAWHSAHSAYDLRGQTSGKVLEILEETIHGPSTVQRVDCGMFTAGASIVTPEMNLCMASD